jgi:hypothetical protein
LAIAFSPTEVGQYSGSAILIDNSLNAGSPYAKQTIQLSGTSLVSISLTPATLPRATVGAMYSQTLQAIGGIPPFTYATTKGALPRGWSLSASGILSGTATEGGVFYFTVTATDNSTKPGPYTGSQSYVIGVYNPTITLTPTTLPPATVGVGYRQIIRAMGGTAPYNFKYYGTVPPGLITDGEGDIGGAPTVAGKFEFQITAKDSSTGTGPFYGTQDYLFIVNQAMPTIKWKNPSAIVYGTALSAIQLNATASVAGTFTYNPAAGTVLAAGTQILSVTFTPANTTNYRIVTGTVNLTVIPANLTITAANATKAYGTANPAFTGTVQDRSRQGKKSFPGFLSLLIHSHEFRCVPEDTRLMPLSYQIFRNKSWTFVETGAIVRKREANMARRFPPVSFQLEANGRFGVPEFEPLLNSEQAAELLQIHHKHCRS